MTDNECPHCGMMLTAKEAKQKNCPVCKRELAATPATADLSPDVKRRLGKINASVATTIVAAEPATPAAPAKPIRRFARLAGGGLILFMSVGLLVVTLASVARWMESANWPTADAEIVSSDVAELIGTTKRGRTVIEYMPHIEFKFTAGGTEHTSSVICFERNWEHGGMYQSTAQGIVDSYPVGSRATVVYDPAKPDQAILTRTLSITAWQMIVVSAAITWLGLRLFLPACVSAARHTARSFFAFQPRATFVDAMALVAVCVLFFVTWFGESLTL